MKTGCRPPMKLELGILELLPGTANMSKRSLFPTYFLCQHKSSGT